MTAHPHQPVLPAQSGPLDDRAVCEIRNLCHKFRRNEDLTTAEATWLQTSLGPLMDELIMHRSIAVGLQASGYNVVMLGRH